MKKKQPDLYIVKQMAFDFSEAPFDEFNQELEAFELRSSQALVLMRMSPKQLRAEQARGREPKREIRELVYQAQKLIKTLP